MTAQPLTDRKISTVDTETHIATRITGTMRQLEGNYLLLQLEIPPFPPC